LFEWAFNRWKMYFVYALQSQKDARIYVGLTSDLEKRLTQHNNGKTKSTKFYIPWKIIYFEECIDRIEARNKEKYWKSGIGKEKLKRMAL
jgi:putative endonuclease